MRYILLLIVSSMMYSTEVYDKMTEGVIWDCVKRQINLIKAEQYVAAAELMSEGDREMIKKCLLNGLKHDDKSHAFFDGLYGKGNGEVDNFAKISKEEIVAGLLRFGVTRNPKTLAAIKTLSISNVGIIKSGHGKGLVVAEMTVTIDGRPMSTYEVIPVVMTNDVWYVGLKSDLSAIVKAIGKEE